jgi:hypothetical protein
VRFVKDPSHSKWEEFCYLEVDSIDRVGRPIFWLVLGKSGNLGLLEACVR